MRMARRAAIFLSLVALSAPGAWAEPAGGGKMLDAAQQQGLRLFLQSCGVCHTRPTMTSGLYGPALFRDSVAGKEEGVRELIRSGTPRMPGFQYELAATEIDAIIDYLKTVPAPSSGSAGGDRHSAD
jgi:mono/diheme cytochrome c family protein